MADKIPTTPAGAPPGAAAPAPVAGQPTGKPAATPAPSPSAAVTAQKHGGLAGAKKRKDGLLPNSKEALEADREKDAERQRIKRANQASLLDPPPIPSASGPGQAQAGNLGAVPGTGGIPPVAWQPEALAPLVKQLVATAEMLTVEQIAGRAEQAHLPGKIINDMRGEAAWHPMAKVALETSAPQVAAKWLNKSGVSAEHQPEIVMGTAIASIFAGQFLLLRRMDDLIRKTNPPVETPEKQTTVGPKMKVGATPNGVGPTMEMK